MPAPLPLLVGYEPDAAERCATELGYTVVWVEGATSRWLPAHHAPRVLRQRLLAADTVEFLRGEVPTLPDEGKDDKSE